MGKTPRWKLILSLVKHHFSYQKEYCLIGVLFRSSRNAKVTFVDREDKKWHPVEQSTKGHFVFDLLGQFNDKMEDVVYLDTIYDEPESQDKTEIPDEILELHDEIVKVKVWEVFTDRANLTATLENKCIETAIFSLQNGWDLRKRLARA